MKFEEILMRLKEQFGEAIEETSVDSERSGLLDSVFVRPENLVEVCRFLHDDPDLELHHLNCVTGTDFKDAIHIAYVMTSYTHHHQLAIKVKLDRDNPSVATVEGIWATANWQEREIFDLLGVNFEGHSDLRRLLMPDDWVGYPLRKDYQDPPDYHGMPTTRENPLGKF